MESQVIGKNYNAIDIMKFVAALLIVAIHTSPLLTYGTNPDDFLINILARIAVPFFFVASGFFLAKKGISDRKNVLKYLKRVLILYVIWSVIYLPLIIGNSLKTNYSFLVKLVILARNFIFVGSYVHFWYFTALISAILLIYILIKKISIQKILVISLVLYVVGMLGDTYFGLIKGIPQAHHLYNMYFELFQTTRNGLFFGMLFVAIGVYINSRKSDPSVLTSGIGFGVSLVLLFVEGFLVKKYSLAYDYNMYIMLIPTIFFLFYLLKSIQLNDSKIYLFLRHSSILIFASHLLFKKGVNALAARYSINILLNNSLIDFVVIVLVSVAFSYCILQLESKAHLKWLKYLH